MQTVDDAHAHVRTAMQSLATIEVGSLNETERQHTYAALRDLQQLDAALAERSGLSALDLAKETPGDPVDTGGDA